MPAQELDPELERRLALLERPENQGEDYDGGAWAALILLGILLPILAIWLGRS